ncbi:hypothetical protein [Clostridium thailandense]|uniref:GAP1-N2 domain-containing protein n=1 Tax=Clostridium thailandense TaxID=2794346 RepID=UPI0039893BC2
MAVKQLFYTSCKKGLSSGMGFQTYSMSKGISDEERKEIEGYCVYIPPDNLPTQPSDKEIEELFPIAFSSFRLKNGKNCICSAKYIGKDYSGRYGNYFCHVFISDKAWPFYPIELYGSAIFRSSLTYEEENAEEIEYLPELNEIPLGNLISFDSIGNFLKEAGSGKRRKGFTELMNCCIGFSSNRKKIVICDYKDNISYWIGSVQMSLPKKLAQEFSFTTYCHNPEDVPYMLCAADNNGSRFNFKDSQKLYKYNIFHFIDMQVVETNYNSSFVKRAEVGYTVSKETFLPLLTFIEQFQYNILDENIDNCVCLYNMVNRGIEKINIQDVKNAVSFAVNYKSVEAYKQLFELLNHNLEKISTQVDIELADIITKFLFMVGKETNSGEHIIKAYEFFFNSIHYLIMDAEEVEVEEILTLYKNIRSIKEVTISQFVKLSIHKDRIKGLQTYLEGGKVRHAKFYFKSVISDIITFNSKYASTDGIGLFNIGSEDAKNITIFLNKCLSILIQFSEDIVDVFCSLKYEYEYLPEIIVRAYSINNYLYKNESIEETLVGFVIEEGRKDKEWEKKICLEISKLTNGNNFLFSIYSLELKNQNNKKNFFVNYCYRIFNSFKDYRKRKFSDALNLYLNLCQDDILLEDYKEIISYISAKSLNEDIDKKVFEVLFTGFENEINVENIGIEIYTIKKVIEIKKKYNIKTPYSMVEMIYIMSKIEDSSPSDKIVHLENLKVDFSNMDADKYAKCLIWFLNNLCPYLKSPLEHDKMRRFLFCSEYVEIYYKEYLNILDDIIFTKKYKEILKLRGIEGHEIFMDFLIFLFKNDLDMSRKLETYLNDKISNILKEISEKKLETYSNYIEKKVSSYINKTEIVYKWIKIRDDVKQKKQKRTPFNIFKK